MNAIFATMILLAANAAESSAPASANSEAGKVFRNLCRLFRSDRATLAGRRVGRLDAGEAQPGCRAEDWIR